MEISEKIIEEYYKCRNVGDICKELEISRTTFQRIKKSLNLPNRRIFLNQIDTGYQELNQTLKTKYMSIVNRCTGKSTDKYGHYKGTEYMTIIEWVNLCNANKNILADLWSDYLLNGKSLKYSPSIDRLDNAKGYIEENIEFVPHGYNSWKRNIYPVSVEHNAETHYFMSSEEGSRFYGVRKQTINECLRKTKYHLVDYVTLKSTIEDVLEHSGKKDIKEYYENLIQN